MILTLVQQIHRQEVIEYLLIWHLRQEKLIEILNSLIMEVINNV